MLNRRRFGRIAHGVSVLLGEVADWLLDADDDSDDPPQSDEESERRL